MEEGRAGQPFYRDGWPMGVTLIFLGLKWRRKMSPIIAGGMGIEITGKFPSYGTSTSLTSTRTMDSSGCCSS